MDDYTAMAMAVIAFLQPYVLKGGAAMAKGTLGEAGKEVWGWLKTKFTKPAQQEAVKELEAAPQDETNWEALKVQLVKALRDDEAFRRELEARLPEPVKQSISQQMTISGTGNVGIQNAGSGNVSIQC
jgi:hypothetical protein